MTLDQLYAGIIPAFPYGTVVQYKIQAFDYANNWAASGVYSYTVGVPPKLPPVAKFTESAETVYTGVVITFNATSSYDPDGTIISYVWYFGDGTNATGVIVSHAYSDEGKYIVNLTVTDENGLTGTFISIKTVLNRPPVAHFTENATTVLTRETIHFDASSSYDPDGYIIAYIWNFGDGASASGVSVSHSYEDKGTYNVTLTVIDNDGASSSYSAVKTVLSRPSAGLPLALLAAIGLGVAALTATLLYALYRRRKTGMSTATANPGNKVQPKPVVTLYVPAKILSRFEIKPLKLRTS
jgi:PKD repeat protein